MDPMPRFPQDVTDAELAVLEVLWDKGPSSRRQIADVLYPGGQPVHYTTVQKLLERLHKKGHVACEADSPVRTFAATVSRDALISRRLLDVAEKLCEGSMTPLLMNLVRAQPLSEQELTELRALVKELSKKHNRKNDTR
jgi:BlaI family transcriptional regulator, penicillinase repressor